MKLSVEQDKAALAIARWFRDDSSYKQVFSLFGYAGTGKTTIAKYIAQYIPGEVRFAAYTGKAAEVLRSKGCDHATTLHSLMYLAGTKDRSRLLNLNKTLERMKSEEEDTRDIERAVELEYKNVISPTFSINVASPLHQCKLLIVDECSMIDRKLGEDLVKFNIPILLLGDPFQLPPVKGTGYFTANTKDSYSNGKPDFLLEQVHRQSLDSPVLQLATQVRTFKHKTDSLRKGIYGDSIVMNEMPAAEEILKYDQNIIGLNKTRHSFNNRYRELLGFKDSPLPVVGDKLVCRRNNHELGLLNGSQWRVLETLGESEEGFSDLHVEKIDNPDEKIWVKCHNHEILGRIKAMSHWEEMEAEKFNYGYFITCHTAQGSQWDSVMIFDQSYAFRQDAKKWLYTAITRAAKNVTIVRAAGL